MLFDAKNLSPKEKYRLLTTCVVPRPIAWVTSVNASGVVNAAPFSFFNVVSTDPPVIMISIGRRSGALKDTFRNIQASGEFVVNIVSEDLAERMNITAAGFPPSTSELEAARLSLLPSVRVKTPGIKESPIQLECRLRQSIEVGNSDLLLGDVLTIGVSDSLIRNGAIDPRELKAVGRLSGNAYCRTTDVFEMERL